jgi:hypothetical protein
VYLCQIDQYNGLVRNLSSSPHCLPLSLLLFAAHVSSMILFSRGYQSLPLTVSRLSTALAPLLIAVFSRIVPPALGPAAFLRFFEVVHARLAAIT